MAGAFSNAFSSAFDIDTGGTVFISAWAINSNSVVSDMQKNTASQVIGAQMVSASDGSAFTGSVTCYVTGDGGTQALGSVGSGVCTHEGNGFHTYAPAQAETNYDQISFTFIGTGAVPASVQVYTGTPQSSDHTSNISAILADTAEIGTAGAGLTEAGGTGDQFTGIASVGAVTGGINTGAGTITTLDALDAAQDTRHDETQTLVSGLSSATSIGLAKAPDSDNSAGALNSVTLVGTIASGTFADLAAATGVYVQIDDATNVIDYVVGLTVPVNAIPTTLLVEGYCSGVGDSIGIYVYENDGPSWDLEATLVGKSNNENDIATIPLGDSKYVNSSGIVYVRFTTTAGSNQQLNLDQVLVGYQNQTVGYADGAIWIDSNASNTNTTRFVDGVADNPVSTITAANTLNSSLSLNKFYVRSGSSITFAASQTSQTFHGEGWTLALGGQDVSNSHFYEAIVSGIGTTGSGNSNWHLSDIGTATMGPSDFHNCDFTATLTAGTAGDYFIHDCKSGVAGSGSPSFDFNTNIAGATNVNVRNWFGGGTWTLNSNVTASIEVAKGGVHTIAVGGADVEFRGFCRSITLTGVAASSTVNIIAFCGPISINGTGGTVNVYGQHSGITDSSGGLVTINDLSVDGNSVGTNIAAILEDTETTIPATIATVDGNIDTLVSGIITGAAAAGTLSTTQSSTNLTGYADDQLIGRVVTWTSGACEGESTDITDYTETNGVLSFTALTTAPSASDTFKIT